jgi:FkbM family methyltransferase
MATVLHAPLDRSMNSPRWLVPQAVRDATRLLRQYSARELMGGTLSFAQSGEDLVLAGHFFRNRKTGFYVDVGAHDPIRYSNTQFFYRSGWRGINVEPIPASFRKFEKYRKRDINLNLAVSLAVGEEDFTIDGIFSRLKGNAHEWRNNESSATHIRVRTKPLSLILDEHLPADTPIDFLSIDCEGHDRIVLESNDWKRYRPTVVLTEDLEGNDDLDRFMLDRDYSFLLQMAYTKVFFNRKTWVARPS